MANGNQQQQQQRSDPSDSLFAQQHGAEDPWWQKNFLLQQPTIVNAWNGVFPTVIVNIFGIVIFLRLGWIVGTAGVPQAILILILCTLFSAVTVLSAIGICERCEISGGGIYHLISKVLGRRIGGSIGIIYTFGQATAISLSALGFGESMTKLFDVFNPVTTKILSIVVLVVLTVLNFAGLRFIIRLTMLLLCFLGVAILDFTLGGFLFTHDPAHGIGSWSGEQMQRNWESNYASVNCTVGTQEEFDETMIFQTKNESFFSVFAVLFANFIGVLAGVNMSGNLQDPLKNIADGELSALGVSFLLCFLFMVMLGASVDRMALLCDYIISKRISVTKILFLGGLYIACLSSILSSTLGTSRVIQGIASEGLIPFLTSIIHEDVPTKEPIKATIFVTAFAVLFVVLGDLNQLAILSTVPFLVTYAFVNYSYMSLAMSADLEKLNRQLGAGSDQQPGYGSVNNQQGIGESGSQQSILNSLFRQSCDDERQLHTGGGPAAVGDEWEFQPSGKWYSRYINRYISFAAAIVDILVVVLINKWFALLHAIAFIAIYIYLGKNCPASEEGISKFSIAHMIRVAQNKSEFTSFFSRTNNKNAVVPPTNVEIVPGNLIAPGNIQTAQLNDANQDFPERKGYHHSENIGNIR